MHILRKYINAYILQNSQDYNAQYSFNLPMLKRYAHYQVEQEDFKATCLKMFTFFMKILNEKIKMRKKMMIICVVFVWNGSAKYRFLVRTPFAHRVFMNGNFAVIRVPYAGKMIPDVLFNLSVLN